MRTYLRVSWVRPATEVVDLAAARAGGVVGVDLNADHLAATRLDTAGNPVGRPLRVPLDLAGASSATRDGRLRAAVTAILEHAKTTGATAIAVEDLDFADSKSREKFGRRKAFRHPIAGFPTTQFKDRCRRDGSHPGARGDRGRPALHQPGTAARRWQRALSTPTVVATRHEGASVAIGRRALGHGLTTRAGRPGVTASAARPPPERWKHDPHTCGPGTGNHRHGRGRHPSRRPPTTGSHTTALPAPTPSLGCGHAWRAVGSR